MSETNFVVPDNDNQQIICELHRTVHYDVPMVRALIVRGDQPPHIDLYQQLQGINTFKIIGETGYWQDTHALVGIHQPHAVIISIVGAATEWLETVQQFSRNHPEIRIALLASYTEDIIRQAMRAGATIFLSIAAHAVEIERAIRSVLSGGMYFSQPACAAFLASYAQHASNKQTIPSDLTPRQLEVLRLIAKSHTTKQIAHLLGFRLWTDPPFLSCEFAQHRNFESWAAECYLAAKTTV